MSASHVQCSALAALGLPLTARKSTSALSLTISTDPPTVASRPVQKGTTLTGPHSFVSLVQVGALPVSQEICLIVRAVRLTPPLGWPISRKSAMIGA